MQMGDEVHNEEKPQPGDAGFLQGPLNSVSDIVGHKRALPVIPFETLNSRQRTLRRFRQLRLGPAQQRAGGSNLFDRNH